MINNVNVNGNNQGNEQLATDTTENNGQIHTDAANGNEQIDTDIVEALKLRSSEETDEVTENNDDYNDENDNAHRGAATTETRKQIPTIEGNPWGPRTYHNAAQVGLGLTPTVYNENDCPGA